MKQKVPMQTNARGKEERLDFAVGRVSIMKYTCSTLQKYLASTHAGPQQGEKHVDPITRPPKKSPTPKNKAVFGKSARNVLVLHPIS